MLNVGFEFDAFSFSLFGLFDLLDLASLSTTNAVSFLGSMALFCCAQLPKMMRWNGKKGAHEQPSAMVSTSPITASSCSSPGCCGSVAVARSFFDRSLHRHSTARAVLRQKKKGLNERATAAASAPALSSAGMHSPLRAIHSRKKCPASPIAWHPSLHLRSLRGIPCQRPSSISIGSSPKRVMASRRAWCLLSTCSSYSAPGQRVLSLFCK